MSFEPMDEEDDTFTEEDWLEGISPQGQTDNFSVDAGEAVVPVYIENATEGKLRSALTFVLGYSYPDDGDPYLLHRVSPVAHPIFGYQMRAHAASFTRFNPVGNPDNEDNKPYKTSLITGEEGGIARYARYGQCWMVVKFAPRNDYLYEDDSAEWSGAEYDRYVEIQREGTLDVLNSDTGGALKFADGTDNNPKGKSFPASVGELIYKNVLTVLWKHVAFRYTHDADGVPTKIDRLVGTVNSEPIFGCEKGTLLFLPPTYEKKQFNFWSNDGRALFHNILLRFSHFDPPLGDGQTLDIHGHNLFPWRHGGGPDGGPGWYYCTRDGQSGGPSYLRKADHRSAFDHVDKP